ncbi:MAG: hypothetical protein DRR06_17075, partial [Gammaproteobacteria bacterium]
THIGLKKTKGDKAPSYRNPEHVWAEVEVGDDVDWQTEANKRAERYKNGPRKGKIKPVTAHITDQVPEDGYYRYKTNHSMLGNWIIAGTLKVKRLLTDAEVSKINDERGFKDLPRKGAFNFEEWGFNADGTLPGATKPEKKADRDLWDQNDTQQGSLFKLENDNGPESPEWKAAKAKGLDMSKKARTERAEDMGFDTKKTWYHANTGGILGEGFDNNRLPARDPDAPFNAHWFSGEPSEFAAYPVTGNTITPVFLQRGKEGSIADVASVASETYEKFGTSSDVRERLVSEGFDLVLWDGRGEVDLNELRETGETTYKTTKGSERTLRFDEYNGLDMFYDGDQHITGYYEFGTPKDSTQDEKREGSIRDFLSQNPKEDTIAVLNPKIIRSVNAVFDPDQADSPNIMFRVSDSDVEKKMYEFEADITERLGLDSFFLSLRNNGAIQLSNFIVPTGDRKSGTGSKAMQELTNFADQHDRPIFLEPASKDDQMGTTSRSRLVKFYKRFGFVENKGRNKNFTYFGGMYRNPNPGGMFRVEEEGFDAPVEKLTDTVLRHWQDKMRPLLKTEKAIGGVEIEESAYRAEEAFHGKTENDLRLLKETYLEPLSDAMGRHNIKREELDLYLVAKHARERNKQIAKINPKMPDGGSGMTNQEASDILARFDAEGRTAALRDTAAHVYGLLEHQRGLMRSGLQDDSITDTWERTYSNYVPLKGYADDENFSRIGRGFDIRGKESMRALGRRTMAESPVLHAIKDTTDAAIRKRKNEVGNVFLDMVEANPNPGYWDVFTEGRPDKDRRVVKIETEESKDARALARTNKTRIPSKVYREEVKEMPVPMHMLKDRYFATKRDGKTYYIKLADKRLIRAMQNMGPESMNKVLQVMNAITRWLSAMSTSYNPEFMISNMSRDIQTAIINLLGEQDLHDGRAKGTKLVGKMVKSVPMAVRVIHASLYNKALTGEALEWQKDFDQFREDGAKTGWFDMKDVDGQAKELERMIDVAQGGAKGQVLKFVTKVKDLVEHANSAIENGVRLSVYKHAIDAMEAQGMDNLTARKKAASLAKNLTVNFNRKGEYGQVLNSAYMFANASIQGTATFARAMGTMKVNADGTKSFNMAQKFAGGLVAGSFALAMLNRFMAGDDDDGENWYDKVPQHVRERNIVLMKSVVGGAEGEYYTIPLPYGYNIFYNLGDSAEAMINSDSRGIGELAVGVSMAMLGSFSPIGFESSKR